MSSSSVAPLDIQLKRAQTTDKFEMSPPIAQYVRVDDQLIVDIIAQATKTVSITYRYMRTDGIVVECQANILTINDSLVHSQAIPLNEGYILGATAVLTTATAQGDVFILLSIGRAIGSGTFLRSLSLCSSYITQIVVAGWPGGRLSAPIDQEGKATNIVGAAVAANTEIDDTVTVNHRWNVISGRWRFVAGAGVANRTVAIVIADGGGFTVYRWRCPQVIIATQTWDFDIGNPSQVESAANNELTLFIPDNLIIRGGFHIKSLTLNMQAGDQWSLNRYCVLDRFDV